MTDLASSFFDGLQIAEGRMYLMYRQEMSRRGSGVTQGKDLGPPIWGIEFQTHSMPLSEAYALETQVMSLEGIIGRVEAYEPRRPRPAAWVSGQDLSSTTVSAINGASRKLLTLTGGFTNMSVGDMIGFDVGGILYVHRVTELVSGEIKVVPDLPAALTTGTSVTLEKPTTRFRMNPESLDTPILNHDAQLGQASLVFSGFQDILP